MSEFAAANTASMVLFVGNPTNVVICEGFGIENAAFTGWTFFPFAACSVTCLGALYAQYRATGKLMSVLPPTSKLRAREAINDLPGAIVGTILLGGCLVTTLVISFLDIDVWKIALPFACAKFLFDAIWDLYRVRIIGIDKVRARMQQSLPQNNQGDPALLTESQVASSNSRLKNDSSLEISQTIEIGAFHADPSVRSTGSEVNNQRDTEEEPRVRMKNDPEKLEAKGDSPDSTMESVVRDYSRSRHAPREKKGENPSLADKAHIFTPDELRWWESVPLTRAIVAFVRDHLPTLYNAFPRLPFALVPFAFSQFILIEALSGQGWIDIFARWLVIATKERMYPTLWITGIIGVILCNISGTNIGATILLTKVVRAANLPPDSTRSAGIALAVASNIGAVSLVFSASLAGLLWKAIIDDQKPGNKITQRVFAKWNIIPLTVMMGVGLAVVSLEMHIKYR